jgi:ferritin-like metal-binding protein YciE
MLRHHKEETERQEQRLRERLDALGAGTSTRKQAQTIATALMKGAADEVRGDQAGKNARDGYVTEHMEIAAYQLLERLAERDGDTQTAEVARQNRAEEEAMAQKIDSNWDRFLELTLAENDMLKTTSGPNIPDIGSPAGLGSLGAPALPLLYALIHPTA